MNNPVLKRQKIRQAIEVAMICWVASVALMVAGILLYQGVQQ